MNEQIGTLQPIETDQSIPAKLDVAKRALAEATEDWQRIDIRDYARALAAATAILNRKEIQVQAANLVHDAERAIAKANPPMSNEESLKRANRVNPLFNGEVCKPNQSDEILETHTPQFRNILGNARKAHNHISDEEFEAKKAESVETGTPLTRSTLIEEGKRKRRAETREQREESLSAKATQLPTGEQKFSVIYADPPWRYDFSETTNRQIENQYPTMDIEEIKAVNVSEFCHTDAVLYLWATAPKLREGLAVMEAWGFEYKTNMVWVKDKIGMGYWARSQHELILIGTRGTFSPPPSDKRVSSIIEAPRTKHSKKPVQCVELLENLYPEMAKIELFSREPREGWAAWGNEVIYAPI